MTKIDTSAEALDVLLSELHFQGSLREDAHAPDADTSKALAKAWSTLRALVAERDGLDALIGRMHTQDVNAIKQWQAAHPGKDMEWPGQIRLTAWCLGEVTRWRDECERLRLGGCARGQTTTQWCAEAVQMMAERDSAQAEAARLRDAERNNWHRICDVVALLTDRTQPGDQNTLVPVTALNRYARAADLAHKIKAAALAQEPRHD